MRVEAASPSAWREWLELNHEASSGVWLVLWKKHSRKASLDPGEAIDHALCFGWVDAKVRSIDVDRYEMYFSPRKPTSAWSRINKERIAAMSAAGLMRPAGEAAVARARENGTWSVLDDAEALVVAGDLGAALDAVPGARKGFEGLSPGKRRDLLGWVALAKRQATRARRIEAIVAAARRGGSAR